jgi:hypothetical protein
MKFQAKQARLRLDELAARDANRASRYPPRHFVHADRLPLGE